MFLSLKSIVSLSILLISVGIGAFLYFTLDEDFEAKPNISTRSRSLKSPVPIDEINQIISTARHAWSIIDKNRAVADIQTSYGNVLPANITDPFQLQSWSSSPASHSFTVDVYNRLKQRVLQFTYAVQFTYGGSLDGKGAYLDRVTIIPSRVSVAWGFVFNANVKIAPAGNVGTSDNPIAAADVELHYRLVGLNIIERTESFRVTGDGKYTHLS